MEGICSQMASLRSEEEEEEEEEEDRLSNLPEPILHHILSFLPTKQVVHTCLLSKKWRHFWVSVPYLEFYIEVPLDPHEYYNEASMNLVDRVLYLRGNNSPLQRLRLRCGSYCDPGRLYSWITTAVSQDVRELDIKVEIYDEDLYWPTRNLNSSTRMLKLEYTENLGFHLYHSMFSAANLKFLELVGVDLPKGNSKGELVLSCPVLEVLILKNCCLDQDVEVLKLVAHQLEKLVLDDVKFDAYPFFELCELELHAPNLLYFVHRGPMYTKSSLVELSALISAEVFMKRYFNKKLKKQEALRAIQLLRGLCSARDLVLNELEIFQEVPDAMGGLLTSYDNLKNLKLKSCLDNAGLKLVAFLLSCCPSIETLVLEVTQDHMQKSEKKEKPLLPPQCTLNNLKYVTVQGLGYDYELEFLRFLLRNAVVLERLTIMGYASDIRTKFNDELMKISKLFPSFDLSFKVL